MEELPVLEIAFADIENVDTGLNTAQCLSFSHLKLSRCED